MKQNRIKLSGQEIKERLGCSLRHARRLRASDDERCYANVSDYGGEARTQVADDKSVLGHVRKIMAGYERGMMLSFLLTYKPDDYTNPPANMDEILAAVEQASEAVRNIETVAGFYFEDEEDGTKHSGEQTVYELAQRGAKIHRSYRAQVLAWAEKYGRKLNVTFWGRPDGIVEEDADGKEIPGPPDETINDHADMSVPM